MKGISVIIPCYNAELYIERCLNSILSSKYENVEIILVNDDSKDETDRIIRQYIELNSSVDIKYVNNIQNLGAGESRNIGIKNATKEYIVFVDADDVVDESFLNEINRAASENNSDCIIFNAATKSNGNTYPFKMFYGGRFVGEQSLFPKYALVYIKGCTCGKAYKREIIQGNDISFASLKRNEDLVFTKTAVSYCQSIYYLDKVLYYYYDNPESLMHDKGLLDKQNAFKAYDLIYQKLSDRNFEAELNSIYLIEVLYSTTMTCIRKGEDAYNNYQSVKLKYDRKDPYYQGYNVKYRIILRLFKAGMFNIISKIV